MSDVSSLTELARFVGRSGIMADGVANKAAVNELSAQLNRRMQKQRVSDLLSVVLALSARTRRMIMPRVEVELDVFSPGGQRAVRIAISQ